MLATMVPADMAAIDVPNTPGLQLYDSAVPNLSEDTHFADMTQINEEKETEEASSEIEAMIDGNLAEIEREIGHILQQASEDT